MKRSDLAHQMAHEILVMIEAGELRSGDHLSTLGLAERFGVSRSPVREALELLANQGILSQVPNKGFFLKHTGSVTSLLQDSKQRIAHMDVYSQLAEDWLNSRVPSEMTEMQLRSRYELTKSELGDILLRAAREGWAERKKGYGWRFLPVAKTAEAFEQIYRFRMVIEPAALLEPTFAADRKILTELRSVQERLLDTDVNLLPPEHLLSSGSQFHENLIRLSGNAFYLMSLVRVNRMRRLLEYRSKLDRERLVVQCQQHIDIIKLLEKGEVLEASYLLKRHLSGALSKKSPVDWRAMGDPSATQS